MHTHQLSHPDVPNKPASGLSCKTATHAHQNTEEDREDQSASSSCELGHHALIEIPVHSLLN